MARPQKSGLDYFPLDIDFFTDDKIKFIRARFKAKGTDVTVRLLCKIYRNGYFLKWDDDTALVFSSFDCDDCTVGLANDVVEELVKRGFFDEDIFNRFDVLTSKGIQKRYLSAFSERKEVHIIRDYWLCDIPEDTKKIKYIVSSLEIEVSAGGNIVNAGGNTQSKEKKRKGKESKEDTCPSAREAQLGVVIQHYEKAMGDIPVQMAVEDIEAYLEIMEPDVIIHAIDYAIAENKRSWSYIKAILKNRKASGIKTMADVLRVEAEREVGKNGRTTRASGGSPGASSGWDNPGPSKRGLKTTRY